MGFYWFARGLVKGLLHLCLRIHVEGKENIPQKEACLVCSNHKSVLDPPLLGSCLPFRMGFMAKEELFRNKIFGALIRSLGAFPIKRGKSDVGALRSAMKMLENGESLVIFPEGGRSPEGHLRRGKQGAALIAAKTGVCILPVGIEGRYRFWGKMTVRIGQPIPMDGYKDIKLTSEELQKITDETLMPTISALAGVRTYENRNCG